MKPRSLVAVVDDDDRILESMENLLESAGYAVRTFSSGAALLGDPLFTQFDCLISDIAMPGMDGIELQRRIYATRPQLPILFITALETANLPIAGDPSCLGVLRKPFAGPELLGIIAKAFAELKRPPCA